jgi:hypothetical protein
MFIDAQWDGTCGLLFGFGGLCLGGWHLKKKSCSVIKALGQSNGEDRECSLNEESEMITVGTWGRIW